MHPSTSGPVQGVAQGRTRANRTYVRSTVFSFTDSSLYVAALDLWIDAARRRERCFVSHGHADHARPHAVVVTSPAGAHVCRARFGGARKRSRAAPVAFEEHPFNEPWDEGGCRLTLFPAGHVLGSAQLEIASDAGSFVYTGDFKLARSYTCEPAEVRRCDVLLMECTFGRPQYAFPSRDEVEDRLIGFATRALEDGRAPLVLAYSLGKAQEAMAILAKAGVPLTVHDAVGTMADAYAAAGVRLGTYGRYDPESYDGTSALVWPPAGRTRPKPVAARPARSAMLTGWAVDAGATYRFGVDEAIPLSDHADFPALLRYVELAQPRKVLLVHGPRDFAWRLRRMGVDAEYLEERRQLTLF